MKNQLTFQNTTLTPIEHNGDTWLTSRDLAKALGYAKLDAASRIYDRNEDEFSKGMTETVKLTVSGDSLAHSSIGMKNLKRSTRLFSLRGCHLVAMFSRTEVAKEFRKWVLDILDQETQPNRLDNEFVSKHGFNRVVMVFRNEQLVDSYPLKTDDGIVSFREPKILKEMIKDTMPGYALVNKQELMKAFGM